MDNDARGLSVACDGPWLDSHKHDIAANCAVDGNRRSVRSMLYRELLGLVEGRLIALEEFARQMIQRKEPTDRRSSPRC